MEVNNGSQYKLPVKLIIVRAFVSPWLMRKEMLGTLSLPVLVLISMPYIQLFLGASSIWLVIIFKILNILLYTVFAVTCHRIILMGGESVSPFGIRKWSKRETRFAVWLIGVYLLASFVILLLSLFSNLFYALLEDTNVPFVELLYLLAAIPGIYLFARLCLVFPATAIDKRPDTKWAWETSLGNGWRLTVIVFVVPVILTIAQALLRREGSYLLEDLLLNALGYFVLVIEIAALSLSYKELTTHRKAITPH